MRKILMTIVAALLLSGGAAFAQDTYAGASIGFASAFGVGTANLALHGGADNLLADNIGVRGDLNVFVGAGTAFGLGASALYKTAVDPELPVDVYGGAGPRIVFGGGGSAFGFGLMGGGEYGITDQIGLFGELRVDLLFAGGGSATFFGLGLGANYHF